MKKNQQMNLTKMKFEKNWLKEKESKPKKKN